MPCANGLKLGGAGSGMAEFVRDVSALQGCLERMLAGPAEAVAFWNATRDFRVVLRRDPCVDSEDEEEGRCWELCVWPPEDDGDEEDEGGARSRLADALDLEYGGVWDEDVFVVHSFQRDEPDKECMRAAINEVYNIAVCPCGAHLIRDGGSVCLACHLSHDPARDARHFCAICQQHGSQRHMVRQACCGQMLHRACLSGTRDPRCPLCRASGPEAACK